MKKILITKNVPERLLIEYRKEFDITNPDHDLTREEILEKIPEYDGLYVILSRIDAMVVDAGKKLKVVGNFGVGYDNIDVKYCSAKKIVVVNTPETVTEATAEHSIALIVSAIREIARYDREVRRKEWNTHLINGTGSQVYGSTLGIIGFGRIGKCVCKKAQGLGMKVIYFDKFRASPEIEKEYNVVYMPFDDILKEADCISVHVPYVPENYHMFDINTFKKMKKTAFFVNCARGQVVDENALYTALKEGIIKGAAIDVYEKEPLGETPLRELENITFTPHVGSHTLVAREAMFHECMSGIIEVFNGGIPVNVVNRELFGN